MPPLIEAARRHLDQVKLSLEDHGVSIEVVYALDSIERGLARIELLLPFVDADDAIEPTYEIRAVIAAVGRGLVGGRSFIAADERQPPAARAQGDRARRPHRRALRHRRRAASTGRCSRRRRAAACSRAAPRSASSSSSGGTSPLFIDGVLSAIDYAGSFIVMQLLGFTLATKQPSMTAAALAGTIRDRAGPGPARRAGRADRAHRALAVRRGGRQRLGR